VLYPARRRPTCAHRAARALPAQIRERVLEQHGNGSSVDQRRHDMTDLPVTTLRSSSSAYSSFASPSRLYGGVSSRPKTELPHSPRCLSDSSVAKYIQGVPKRDVQCTLTEVIAKLKPGWVPLLWNTPYLF